MIVVDELFCIAWHLIPPNFDIFIHIVRSNQRIIQSSKEASQTNTEKIDYWRFFH